MSSTVLRVIVCVVMQNISIIILNITYLLLDFEVKYVIVRFTYALYPISSGIFQC